MFIEKLQIVNDWCEWVVFEIVVDYNLLCAAHLLHMLQRKNNQPLSNLVHRVLPENATLILRKKLMLISGCT